MCKYCEGEKKIKDNYWKMDLEIYQCKGEYFMGGDMEVYGGNIDTDYSINYCPMCGRKLNES
jgi:hypothetical protein